jgi:hypothetical protein
MTEHNSSAVLRIREHLVPVRTSVTITRTDISPDVLHKSRINYGMRIKAVVSVLKDVLRSGVTAPRILHYGTGRKRVRQAPRYGRLTLGAPRSSRKGGCVILTVSHDSEPPVSQSVVNHCRLSYPGSSNYGKYLQIGHESSFHSSPANSWSSGFSHLNLCSLICNIFK